MVLPAAHGQHGACAGTMFLPQKPYMPLGSLRAQLCFPRLPSCESDDQLRSVQLPPPPPPVCSLSFPCIDRIYCAYIDLTARVLFVAHRRSASAVGLS